MDHDRDGRPAIDLLTEPPFRVGAATIDPATRDAVYGESVERIQPKNLKVLIALARHRAKLVSRDRIVELCWDGRIVGEDVINRAISNLRQFAERAGGFAIETVPRAGYRLTETATARSPGSRRAWPFVVMTLVAVGAALAIREYGASGPQAPTIVVQPVSIRTEDRAVRAMAAQVQDALTDTLSRTRFALVVATSPSSASPGDLVVVTTVTGDAGKPIVSVTIEEARRRIIVYSHRFEADREPLTSLPDMVGGQVAAAIGWTQPLLMLERAHPSSAELAELLIQSSHDPALSVLQKHALARRLANRAPSSPVAQIGLAFNAGFALWQVPANQRYATLLEGRRAAARARALAPTFGEPFAPWCFLHSTVRSAECEDRLRQGIRIDPSSPWVDWFLAYRLINVGRNDEALRLARAARARDPFPSNKIALHLRLLEATGRGAEAAALQQRAERWWPGLDEFFWSRVSGMIDRGAFDAIVSLERERGVDEFPAGYRSSAAIAAAVRSGSRADTVRLCADVAPHSLGDILCVSALARTGALDEAFAAADRLYPNLLGRDSAEEDRLWLSQASPNGTEYFVGPGASALRRDPRFVALAERTGLLAYWRTGRHPDFCKPPAEPICARLGAGGSERRRS